MAYRTLHLPIQVQEAKNDAQCSDGHKADAGGLGVP